MRQPARPCGHSAGYETDAQSPDGARAVDALRKLSRLALDAPVTPPVRRGAPALRPSSITSSPSPSWVSRVVLVAGMLVLVVVPCHRSSWAGGPGGTEAQAQLSPGLASPGLQAEGGLPPLLPEPGEGGEEAANLGLVRVVVVVAVVVHGDGGHVGDGGEAASNGTAILAGVTSPETAFELFQAREGAVDLPAAMRI